MDTGRPGPSGAAGLTRKRTYNHSDVLPPLLQEVLQELRRAAQGQVLERICGSMPQLQHIQPIPQPGQMDHFSVAEPAEGPLDQTCRHSRQRALLCLPSSLSVSSYFGIGSFYLRYKIKRAEIFILNDTTHEYNCVILEKVWKDRHHIADRALHHHPP